MTPYWTLCLAASVYKYDYISLSHIVIEWHMGQPSVNESLDLVLEQASDHLCGHFCGSWWAHKFLFIFFFIFFLWSLSVIMIAFRIHLILTFVFSAKLRRVLVNKMICQWGADLQRSRVAIFSRLLCLAAACHGSQCLTSPDKWQTWSTEDGACPVTPMLACTTAAVILVFLASRAKAGYDAPQLLRTEQTRTVPSNGQHCSKVEKSQEDCTTHKTWLWFSNWMNLDTSWSGKAKSAQCSLLGLMHPL